MPISSLKKGGKTSKSRYLSSSPSQSSSSSSRAARWWKVLLGCFIALCFTVVAGSTWRLHRLIAVRDEAEENHLSLKDAAKRNVVPAVPERPQQQQQQQQQQQLVMFSSDATTLTYDSTEHSDTDVRDVIVDKEGISWSHGCQVPPGPQLHEIIPTPPTIPPIITGLAVVLAKHSQLKGITKQKKMICNNVPTQLAFFYEPQGIDLIIILDLKGISREDIVECLKLVQPPHPIGHKNDHKSRIKSYKRLWQNLDDSENRTSKSTTTNKTSVTTYEYKSPSTGGKSRIFLAEIVMPFPDYIQRNPAILKQKIVACDPAPPDYIQGTRFYTANGIGLLGLSILKNYDYWLKVDTDIYFNATIPIHLLHDMKLKGALFAHSAEFPDGFRVCTTGMDKARSKFVESVQERRRHHRKDDWANMANWSRPCSKGLDVFDRATDQYYTNFIIGDVKFWLSSPVRQFGTFLNDFNPGFFKYRWTDQIFFHQAMGMFLGPDFRDYVTDYTDFRCRMSQDCWMFFGPNLRNKDGTEKPYFCINGGYFVHHKTLRDHANLSLAKDQLAPRRSNLPYQSKYVNGCVKLKLI